MEVGEILCVTSASSVDCQLFEIEPVVKWVGLPRWRTSQAHEDGK